MRVCVYSVRSLFKKAYLVGFNESSVMSWSLWENTDCFILHATTIVLFLVWKESRFRHVSQQALICLFRSFLISSEVETAPHGSALQGSNNKQGQLDYSLWSDATYCIRNIFCSVNSSSQSFNVSLRKHALHSPLKICQDAFWETASGSFQKSNQSIELECLRSFYFHPSKTGRWHGHVILSEKQEHIY